MDPELGASSIPNCVIPTLLGLVVRFHDPTHELELFYLVIRDSKSYPLQYFALKTLADRVVGFVSILQSSFIR